MNPVALSKVPLARLHDVMAGFVERGEVPGLVAPVSRRGEAHVEALGKKAPDASDPVQRDTIFRIASMTKPITAVTDDTVPARQPITLRDLLTFRMGFGIVMAPSAPIRSRPQPTTWYLGKGCRSHRCRQDPMSGSAGSAHCR